MDDCVKISGTIECDPDDLSLVMDLLPEHITLSRSEVGCIDFSIIQSPDNPCIFHVTEKFLDPTAFEAHTARTRSSVWWSATRHIPRKLDISGT